MSRRLAGIAGMVSGIAGLVVLSGATGRQNTPTTASSDSVAVAVFEGRTPCGAIAIAFTGFPSTGCEKVKWELTLFRDRASGYPRAFLYEGTRTTRHGTWAINRGMPSDPTAVIYRLTSVPSGKALSLLSLNERVLVFLDADSRVLAGDASWSYVLNRTDRKLPK